MDLIIVILILLLPACAQMFITSSYNKYKKIDNKKEMTGFDVAREILDKNDLKDMYIVETKGTLTDHYDPSQKVLRLSKEIYHGSSIASMAVAAHECGHALQDKEGYAYMRIRSLLFPVVNIATTFSYLIITFGLFFQAIGLIWVGIGCVGTGLLFQIVTLPVEIDASKRASKEINNLKIAEPKEHEGVKKMLVAAASTYVAGVLASALDLLRIMVALNSKDD